MFHANLDLSRYVMTMGRIITLVESVPGISWLASWGCWDRLELQGFVITIEKSIYRSREYPQHRIICQSSYSDQSQSVVASSTGDILLSVLVGDSDAQSDFRHAQIVLLQACQDYDFGFSIMIGMPLIFCL